MANIILIKRRISGSAGPPTDLLPGELAFNEVDGTLYIGVSQSNNITPVSTENAGISGV